MPTQRYEEKLSMTSTWQQTVSSIEGKVNTHVFRTYFAPIRCVEETAECLSLALPSKFIRDWVHDNYLDFLRREVEAVSGRSVKLNFTVREATDSKEESRQSADAALYPLSPGRTGRSGKRPQWDTVIGEERVASSSPADSRPDGAGQRAPAADSGDTSSGSAFTAGANLGRRSSDSEGRSAPVSSRLGPGARPLNERYSFDTFVCGSSNQFAYAACKAVADVPATNYNPLFIFGGVGLGKTHLLNAIGLSIQERHPDWNILSLSAENFTNEVIGSIRENRMELLRQKFRERCDVLLMDDIQFLAGKDRTQEEFFHTFNSLHETHRQIVVTSDKLPSEIPELEERLSSRFQWGLIADIQPPELETRVAILEKKALADRINLPSDVAMFLATHIKSNVRELEGSLIRIEAFASLTSQEISLELAAEVLKDILSLKGRRLDAESILQAVAGFYNVRVSELRSHRRHKQIALPRQIAMYLTRELTDLSFPDIGKSFGGKDHSTVMSACRKITRLQTEDIALKQTIESLKKSLSA